MGKVRDWLFNAFFHDPITANIFFSLTVSLVIFLVYLLLLYFLNGHIYYANIVSAKRSSDKIDRKNTEFAKAMRAELFRYAWRLNDRLLLSWVGLDSFVYLQAIRLMFMMMVAIAAPAMIILLPVYILNKSTEVKVGTEFTKIDPAPNIFTVTTIQGVSSSAHWVAVLYNYISFGLIFCLTYSFYRNFTVYRQIFATKPSLCVAQVSLRRMARRLGSLKRARILIDANSKTLLLKNVSARYSVHDLLQMFKSMDISDVLSITVVKDRARMRHLLKRRNDAIIALEMNLETFHDRLLVRLTKMMSISMQALLIELDSKERLHVSQRCRLINLLLNPQFIPEIRLNIHEYLSDRSLFSIDHPPCEARNFARPRTSAKGIFSTLFAREAVGSSRSVVDSILYNYTLMMRCEKEMKNEANSIRDEDVIQRNNALESNESKELLFSESQVDLNYLSRSQSDLRSDDLNNEELEIVNYKDDLLIENRSLAGLKVTFDFRRYFSDANIIMRNSSMPVFVVFKSIRSVAIAGQCLISARPFSLQSTRAPNPSDIVWRNLYISGMERTMRTVIGEIIFILLNIFFMWLSLQVKIILERLLIQSNLASNIEVHSKMIMPLVSGFLPALGFNILMAISPFFLIGIARLQGLYSQSDIQFRLLRRYTFILIIQTFIMQIWSISASDSLLVHFSNLDLRAILHEIKDSIPSKSALFLNIIIQRATISLVVMLLDPFQMMYRLWRRVFETSSLRGAAKRFHSPNLINLGVRYSEYIIFPLFTVLAIAPIAPIISLAGLFFASNAYIANWYKLVFSMEPPCECGGLYWLFIPIPILCGCIAGQFLTLLQLGLLILGKIGKPDDKITIEVIIPIILNAILMVLSVLAIVFLGRAFRKQSLVASLGQEGTIRARNLASRMKIDQENLIRKISYLSGDDDISLIESNPYLNFGEKKVGRKISNSNFASIDNQKYLSRSLDDGSLIDNAGSCAYETVPFNFGDFEDCESVGGPIFPCATTIDDEQINRSALNVTDELTNRIDIKSNKLLESDVRLDFYTLKNGKVESPDVDFIENSNDPKSIELINKKLSDIEDNNFSSFEQEKFENNPYVDPLVFKRYNTLHIPATLIPAIELYLSLTRVN